MDGHDVFLVDLVKLASQWLATLILPSVWNAMATMHHQPHAVCGAAITDVLGIPHQIVVVKATTKGAIDKKLVGHLLLGVVAVTRNELSDQANLLAERLHSLGQFSHTSIHLVL